MFQGQARARGPISGDVEAGYGRVADAFRRNFAEHGEIGAACAIYRDGRQVVDVWGGDRDGRTGAPWERDTMVYWASATKGMATIAVLVADARGLLVLDEPVAPRWPAFAQHGKRTITVRDLLSHRSGLAALDRPVDLATIADPDRLAQLLAAQRPRWPPGTRHGYHAGTFGWCESLLLRRVDPQRRTLGRFFADEVAAPLDVEFHIGLPDTVGPERVAAIHSRTAEMLAHLHRLPWRFVAGMCNPRSVTARAVRTVPTPRTAGGLDNERIRDFVRVEIPAGNGIGQARAVARAYGALATGGGELGIDPDSLRQLEHPAPPPPGGPRDVVIGVAVARTLGFEKPAPGQWFGTSAGRAFGHHGGGGSVGYADPDTGIGFAYAPNRLMPWHLHLRGDPRRDALLDALDQILSR